jgi:hypothetical protein
MVLLLQRGMAKQVENLREKMKADLEWERAWRKREFVALKVSSTTAVPICTILQPSIVVLISCNQPAHPTHIHITIPCALHFESKNCNFLHLNYKKLLQAVA